MALCPHDGALGLGALGRAQRDLYVRATTALLMLGVLGVFHGSFLAAPTSQCLA